jgi:hypothetical protein
VESELVQSVIGIARHPDDQVLNHPEGVGHRTQVPLLDQPAVVIDLVHHVPALHLQLVYCKRIDPINNDKDVICIEETGSPEEDNDVQVFKTL